MIPGGTRVPDPLGHGRDTELRDTGGTKKGPVSRYEMYAVIQPTNRVNIESVLTEWFGSDAEWNELDWKDAALELMTKTKVSRVVSDARDETWTMSEEAFPEVHTQRWQAAWAPSFKA